MNVRLVHRLNADLNELLKLEPDWDSCGAKPIDAAIVAAAKELLKAVPEITIMSGVRVIPVPSGSVQFEASANGKDIEFELESSTTIGYLLSNPDATDWQDGEISVDDLEAVRRIVGWFSDPKARPCDLPNHLKPVREVSGSKG